MHCLKIVVSLFCDVQKLRCHYFAMFENSDVVFAMFDDSDAIVLQCSINDVIVFARWRWSAKATSWKPVRFFAETVADSSAHQTLKVIFSLEFSGSISL